MQELLSQPWLPWASIAAIALVLFAKPLAAYIASNTPQQGAAVNRLKGQFSGVVDTQPAPAVVTEAISKHDAVDALDLLQRYGAESKRGPAYSEALTTISRELIAIGGTT